MKYIVYVTKNVVNDKLYIGVHETEDPNVFDGYIGCGVYVSMPSTYYNPETPFQYAVKKYGPSKFIRSIIAIFDDEDSAYKLEEQLVTKEVVYSKQYYNAVLGGIKPKHIPRLIYQYNINGQFIKEWETKEAANMYSVSKDSFNGSIRHKNKLAGFYWSYEKLDIINLEEYSNPNVPKTVYQYSQEGVCVGIYESLHQLENPGRVCTAIQTRRKYKDHYYSYTLYEEFKPEIKQTLKNKDIYIYDKDGNFYGKAIGVTAAMNMIEGKSRESVYNAINTGKPYKGFRLFLEEQNNLEKISSTCEKKVVNVFDIYGNLLKEYSSINEAVKDLKLDNSSAHRVLKGTQRQTHGYILKYKD